MSYSPGIPTSGQSIPAQDRSLISQNFTQLNNQFSTDHVAFNAGSLNGYHKKITLTGNNALPALSGFQSGINTTPGTADASSAQLLWTNANKAFHLSAVRAWGNFDGTAASPIATTQQYNVDSITRNSTGTYTIVLSANAVTGSSFGVIATCGQTAFQLLTCYQITGASTFVIRTFKFESFALTNSNNITFMVLQI